MLIVYEIKVYKFQIKCNTSFKALGTCVKKVQQQRFFNDLFLMIPESNKMVNIWIRHLTTITIVSKNITYKWHHLQKYSL
jgi:hypothetical protein